MTLDPISAIAACITALVENNTAMITAGTVEQKERLIQSAIDRETRVLAFFQPIIDLLTMASATVPAAGSSATTTGEGIPAAPFQPHQR